MTLPLKILFWILAVALPIGGAWIGSSIAAYRNTATWVPFVVAALAFPVLPLLWEAIGAWRFARRAARAKGAKPKRFLTVGDRMVLRTMALNLLFVGGLFARDASVVFTALSARGDWFLDGVEASWKDDVRGALFTVADQLEWVWDATHDNPYEDDAPPPPPPPPPGELPDTPTEGDDVPEVPVEDAIPEDEEDAPPPEQRTAWPFPAALHPAVASVPASVETDPARVGRYLAEQESNPYRLLKLLHDYVADRIAYDVPALSLPQIPPQGAEKVFRERKGVCSGYARLLTALGEAAGIEIVYVVGVSRDMGGDIGGGGHAWNAARVEGQWYLIDATWDAGHVNGDTFTKKYTADYLMTPPAIFGLNHLPDEPRWQLRKEPISRGEFIRQPNVRPMLFAQGFILDAPTRSQVTVDDVFRIRLQNRAGRSAIASFGESRCDVSGTSQLDIACPLPGQGTYQVELYVGPERYGTHWFAGQFAVNVR